MSKVTSIVIGMVTAVTGFLFLQFWAAPKQEVQYQTILASRQIKPNYENWVEFTPASQRFKVLLPNFPQHAQDTINDPKTKTPKQYEMYVSENKETGSIFMISVITMQESPQANINEDMLSNVVQELQASNPKSKIKNMKMKNYQNFPSMEFSLENENILINGTGFLVANTLYVLTSVTKNEHYNKIEYDLFTNSFRLKGI